MTRRQLFKWLAAAAVVPPVVATSRVRTVHIRAKSSSTFTSDQLATMLSEIKWKIPPQTGFEIYREALRAGPGSIP